MSKLRQRESKLAEKEHYLRRKEKFVTQKEDDLLEKERALNNQAESLKRHEQELAEKEATIMEIIKRYTLPSSTTDLHKVLNSLDSCGVFSQTSTGLNTEASANQFKISKL